MKEPGWRKIFQAQTSAFFLLSPAIDSEGEYCWKCGETSNVGYLFPSCVVYVNVYPCTEYVNWVFFSAVTVALLGN